ncbi:MAG TPA: PQQ-binding-like beta-propeller repeat protein [Anaeromyxobacteraceae bacterium]|nr:PQQ-binding-like beta-propeller repeat protein [Anaeromyxobacteraceae bacterium]
MTLAGAAAALLLLTGAPAPASTAAPVPAPSPRPVQSDSLFNVAWRKALVEPYLLEYKPFEPAGPGIDPLTGMVVAVTRDGYVQAYSADGKELWYFQGKGPYLGSPAVGDGLVFVAGIDGKIHAFDAARGEKRWTYSLKEEFGSQPVIAGDLVYFATLEGTLLALEARTGNWKWHFRREPTGKFLILGAGRPAVVDGVVYQGFADGSVVALDAATGAVKWDRKVGRGTYPDIDADVQVSKDRVYVASYGGQVAALDRASGAPVWEARAPEAYKAKLDGDILVVVTTKEVLGFDARTGKQLWSHVHEGSPLADPVVVKGLVLVPIGKGLLVLDRRTGKKLRFFTRGSGATGSPAVLGKRLYLLSNAGELIAVDLK